MIDIQNLDSKESLEIKFKNGISAKLCLKHWFESNWYFCNIAESKWFWERASFETKFQTITWESHFRSNPTQIFFKIGVSQNICNGKTSVLESLFNKVTALKVDIFMKKRLQHRCFDVNIAKVLRTAFPLNTSGGCFSQL